MIYFEILAAFIWGACLGSFTSAIIHRTLSGKSYFQLSGKESRSACPSCNHTLMWNDLIPIFSWLFQMGKCRYCRHNISWRYLALELLSASFIILLTLLIGIWKALMLSPALPFLLAFIFVLIQSQRIFPSLLCIGGGLLVLGGCLIWLL
jgi:prepilin signal peptidase PulO-like enzyme (type II secretory pathway)